LKIVSDCVVVAVAGLSYVVMELVSVVGVKIGVVLVVVLATMTSVTRMVSTLARVVVVVVAEGTVPEVREGCREMVWVTVLTVLKLMIIVETVVGVVTVDMKVNVVVVKKRTLRVRVTTSV
jgi:hypothetical protein